MSRTRGGKSGVVFTFSSCQEPRRVLWEDQSFDGIRVGVLFFAVVGQNRGADPECKSLPLISRIRHEFAGWMEETLPNSLLHRTTDGAERFYRCLLIKRERTGRSSSEL